METLSQFYIIYPLGLTDFGVMELKDKWSFHYPDAELKILSVDDGGVLIEVNTLQGFSLNHILRSPTRILLRFAEFKARDFPKLFQKISKLNWKNTLIGQLPDIEVSATNSRLFDSRKITKAIHDGLLDNYRRQPVKKKYLDHQETNKTAILPKLYYRAVDDVITISLDTTGELLHKRGDKIYTGLAPIRESFASLLLTATTQDLTGAHPLIDPMNGSGTFLIEAHDENKINLDREYSFQHMPLYIDYPLKKKFLESMQSRPSLRFTTLTGFELNPEVLKLAKKNCEGKKIALYQADLFSDMGIQVDQNVVIINPPYGVRVGEKEEITSKYFEKIIEQIKKKYTPLRLGIIIPEEHRMSFKKDELRAKIPFKNGGLSVVFYVLSF